MAEPVTLDILRGEQVAIVGPNGAGKSRLVDIITGRYPLIGDGVRYDFSPSEHPASSEHIRRIAFRDSYGDADHSYYLQQRWNQHDIDPSTPTVAELLGTARSALGGQLNELFGLDEMADKYIISLSSGELRKFQLARALASAPRLLVLDNPFVGLDAPTRDELRQLLERLVATTDMQLILELSREDEVPDFITHVVPVAEGLHINPKRTLADFRAKIVATETPAGPAPTSAPAATSSAREVLRMNDVSIRYGGRYILSHVTWTVHEGEHWALTGRNGSGKSTLLSLVCADNPQGYACDISLFGRQRGTGESIWDIKRHIGYVSPEMHRAYLKDLPAVDIVASGLRDSVGLYVKPHDDERRQCLAWMRVFGIEMLADHTFLQLSSGEQRLCLLARAFVKDPELLILDEPLHGLDTRRRQMVRGIIEDYCRRPGKTLIMVTHYFDELPPCINHYLELTKPEETE